MATLENQTPVFLLRNMLKFILSSSELADDMLLSMLVGLCKELLPFKMTDHLPNEISIPSVTELFKSGVCFSPINGIMNIRFDDNMFTFRLPVISLDVNTGHSKKLGSVAYEACKAFGPLILTRYTELMNSIIDTADDAKFLKEIGIIINQLKSDKDVANLWNGMSKSINLTKVPFLDKVINDMNKYHSGRLKSKTL
ncbi:hypothetical protein LguiA_009834 [Lonicera macranthoides]